MLEKPNTILLKEENMSLKTDILRAFLDNRTLCDAMKNCDHGNPDIGGINDYHLCGSIFTHTMLVYNVADPFEPIELIMALCHDIGKVATRKVKEDGKVTFYGHADASIQPTIDFVTYLHEKGIITDFEVDTFIKWGLPAIANHMVYYQNLEKKYHFAGDNPMLKHYLNRMAEMDSIGSICKDAKVKGKLASVEYKPYIPNQWDDKKPTVPIWTGLPGSGKDYLAEKTGNPILSFDDIRIKEYCDNNFGWQVLTEDSMYAKSFIYCNENKVDLMKLLKRDAQVLLDNGQDINICNTSLTRKSRRAIINTIGTRYNYVVNQVFVPTEVVFERNANRDSKVVPVDVINRMMNNMTVATHFEPHINEINYILNV
jgi:predicted kinase